MASSSSESDDDLEELLYGDPVANSDSDIDIAALTDAVVFKKELKRLLIAFVEEDGVKKANKEKAKQMLSVLQQFKGNFTQNRRDLPWDYIVAPDEFLCPISNQVMVDPVIIASGKTFDRPSIEDWFDTGNKKCPISGEILPNTDITPNNNIHGIIMAWCVNNAKQQLGVALDFATSPNHQLAILRSMTRLLHSGGDRMKKAFADFTLGIPSIIYATQRKSRDEAESEADMNVRYRAAEALTVIATLDCNKKKIGKMGAFSRLKALLEEGDAMAMYQAATAICILCTVEENKVKVAKERGLVELVLRKMKDMVLLSEMLEIVLQLSTNKTATEKMAEYELIPLLFKIIRENVLPDITESCVAVVDNICCTLDALVSRVKEEDDMHHTLSWLSGLGEEATPKSKSHATNILEMFNRI